MHRFPLQAHTGAQPGQSWLVTGCSAQQRSVRRRQMQRRINSGARLLSVIASCDQTMELPLSPADGCRCNGDLLVAVVALGCCCCCCCCNTAPSSNHRRRRLDCIINWQQPQPASSAPSPSTEPATRNFGALYVAAAHTAAVVAAAVALPRYPPSAHRSNPT